MKREHANILKLENLVRRLPDAKLLRDDCTVLNNACIRLMFEVCAHEHYSSNSVATVDSVRSLLQRLCDNKPVEDLQTGPAARIQKIGTSDPLPPQYKRAL